MYQEKTTHTIVHGDCRDMRVLADKSVDLIITSPPYWQLKDYGGGENQIGFDDSYEDYINHLNLAWQECCRVLRDGCRLCVNIGDQFARSVYYGRYKVIPIHSEIIRFCETLGFDFMGQIIWQKTTTTNTTGGASIMGSFPYPRNGVVKLDFEYILLFKKPGKAAPPSPEQKNAAKMTTQEWNTYFTGHWTFPGLRQDKHLAVFPEELPRRLIKMFSFPGETVLDPFAGSGTTAKAAGDLGRNSVSYEVNVAYIPLIEKKAGGINLLSETQTITESAIPSPEQLNAKIALLPYRFIDCHKLDKKINVKEKLYGSKIDVKSSTQREDFFIVKKIISTELLLLNNDVKIRLLGIKQDIEQTKNAKIFLADKLRGRRVFMKYDDIKHDAEDNLLVYLYLDNKTFINAHLLKAKYAHVDDSIPFKLMDKFIKIRYGDGQMSEQKSVSETAETTALMRAVACFETDAKIRGNDDLAKLFLTEEKRRRLNSEAYRNAVKAAARNGLYEYLIARTKCFDDLFVSALTNCIPQIVLLGAGYDTRAYRYESLIGNAKVFEVDAPFTQKHKTDIMKTSGLSSGKVTYVPVDFEKDDLFSLLIKNGYDSSQKTLYIWEGVTMYLTPESVEKTLSAIADNSIPQSLLSFDYLNIPVSSEMNIIRKDESVLFGLSPSAMEDYIYRFGFRVSSNISFEDMNRQYLTCENGEKFGNIKKTMNILVSYKL